jgi:hypothetical protein
MSKFITTIPCTRKLKTVKGNPVVCFNIYYDAVLDIVEIMPVIIENGVLKEIDESDYGGLVEY